MLGPGLPLALPQKGGPTAIEPAGKTVNPQEELLDLFSTACILENIRRHGEFKEDRDLQVCQNCWTLSNKQPGKFQNDPRPCVMKLMPGFAASCDNLPPTLSNEALIRCLFTFVKGDNKGEATVKLQQIKLKNGAGAGTLEGAKPYNTKQD
jgi:hypothetical protein